jgi:tryptophanyl-tRNA synthetase
LIAHPQRIEQQLRDGAQRLRAQYATPVLARLREAVGLRDLGTHAAATPAARQPTSAALPVFKQYRETDGKFYFKLVDGERVLLQSAAFDSPKDAGTRIAALKRGQFDGTDAQVAFGDGVDADVVRAALAALAAAEAEKA